MSPLELVTIVFELDVVLYWVVVMLHYTVPWWLLTHPSYPSGWMARLEGQEGLSPAEQPGAAQYSCVIPACYPGRCCLSDVQEHCFKRSQLTRARVQCLKVLFSTPAPSLACRFNAAVGLAGDVGISPCRVSWV